jgi:hypothetical protein
MKWYSPLECDNTVADPFVGDVVDLRGVNPERLWAASAPLDRWDPSAFVKASDSEHDGDPDDVLQSALGLPIYSGRLRRRLVEAGITGIQYLPIRTLRSDGREMPGDFAIVNILAAVPALDEQRSKIERYDGRPPFEDRRGQISGILPFGAVLRRAVLEGHDIIRLSQFPIAYFVSEKLRGAFGSDFTGYSFSRVPVTDDRFMLVGP